MRRTLASALRHLAKWKGSYVLSALRRFNALVRRVSSATHYTQHLLEWRFLPRPGWYDHQLDVNWKWPSSGNSLFLERGVFGSLAIEPGASVLELCCGDGFNAKHFYAHRAGRVVAVDFDPDAIAYARRTNAAPNILFQECDIRERIPRGPFDNVMWDGAMEYFTENEIGSILASIKGALRAGGILSGYTAFEVEAREHLPDPNGELSDAERRLRFGLRSERKDLPHQHVQWSRKEDLVQILMRAFSHVRVFATVYPGRTNLYFYASDEEASIPFGPQHPRFIAASTPDELTVPAKS